MFLSRPIARWVQESAIHPLGIGKISKTNMLISLLEKVWYPSAST